MKIFFLYIKSSDRSRVGQLGHRFADRYYALYGADQAKRYGHVAYNDFDICEEIETNRIGRTINFVINRVLRVMGGYGGNWYKIWKLRRRFQLVDMIFSTADAVGLPLVVLNYLKLIPRKPIVYVSIGLPERLEKMRGIFKWLIIRVFQQVDKFVCYGWEEKDQLERIFGPGKVKFIPFGVDHEYFQVSENRDFGDYIFSIGADPNRDFDLLIGVAEKIPYKILLVTTKNRFYELKEKLGSFPSNVQFMTDVSFPEMKILIEKSKFVVLPVKENTYSGGTTVLLQAMAMGKAVVVSQTGAISGGYNLVDDENCLLIKSGDQEALLDKILELLSNSEKRDRVGQAGKSVVLSNLSWNHYTRRLFAVIEETYESNRHHPHI